MDARVSAPRSVIVATLSIVHSNDAQASVSSVKIGVFSELAREGVGSDAAATVAGVVDLAIVDPVS